MARKADYRLDRVVDLPVEALHWDWDEFCFLSERKIHLCISSCCKREAMWPILNLDCLFKMEIPENKGSDCTGHQKLGAQLWARLLCTQLLCSIYQSRQQCFSYLDTVVVPLPTFYLKRQRKKPSGVVQKLAQSLLWIHFYKKTANLMGITWSCWTHWILHKKGCSIILADNNSAAPSRLIFSVRI